MFTCFGFSFISRICESIKAFKGQITTTIASFGQRIHDHTNTNKLSAQKNIIEISKICGIQLAGPQIHPHAWWNSYAGFSSKISKNPEFAVYCTVQTSKYSLVFTAFCFRSKPVLWPLVCTIAVQPVKLSVKLFLLGKNWHWLWKTNQQPFVFFASPF